MLEKINESLLNNFEDRLFPCNITRDELRKKQVKLPVGWTDSSKLYEDFNALHSNSIALRTGNGLTVLDIDTKDFSLLASYMSGLVEKLLEDKATFIVETTNGYHFYFESDGYSYTNAVRIADYVDIRGDGGCVFCYTEDSNSSYRVISDNDPLPLTPELMEYISLQERGSKVTEYVYDNSNKRVAIKPHNYNKFMAEAINNDNIPQLLKACSFSVTDFENTNGLYMRVNNLAFILAMNPAVANEDVLPIIEYVLEEYCGFDPKSPESQKRLNQIFSTLIYSDESVKDICEILEKYSVSIENTLEVLHEDLPFIKHGFNLIFGESKSGKTYTTIKALVDKGYKDQIIHIDFDRNADEKLIKLGVQTFHINDAEALFNELSTFHEFTLREDTIFVIDSLQDLGLSDGIDTNSAALSAMNRVAKFGITGATLIIIHHATDISNENVKIKGNQSTIMSKADIVIYFLKGDTIREMSVIASRAEDKVASGTLLKFNNETMVKEESKYEIPA